ncbi:MAG: succinate dehydrogenase, hydrophobic membrane anchor protein [Gammaproteobacteria bacterium]|nr:succinate dehydrogenase, hydrophobic membrane anchor protein [Gammaproteobacteria bacterium]MDH3373862.1 succinate dehydrogenase, hydrophobic membrane anchor protein [Gammaproteobacteria bacterium]MDH3408404.1 succinate dehydrogenase, hydrophobic membrane anchor protein [Gammaproteobacteria bacterium]MDH3554097.1 succinate dehydrogenase, hydrophobic membrane anchor protein [Gammaproteobacteria bacterium]
MSLRSPLGRVLGLGSAKDGTSHWWGQRVSAVALLLLGIWFAGMLATMSGFSYAEAAAFIARPVNSILLLLLTVSMAYHSYLGVQVVIEDYVHAPGIKVVSLLLTRFVHTLLAVAALYAILKIGLGA